jgi:hypothetical protein
MAINMRSLVPHVLVNKQQHPEGLAACLLLLWNRRRGQKILWNLDACQPEYRASKI